MFVDESFDTELGAGAKTNGQKVVEQHEESSAGQLSQTGTTHTMVVVLAGLLLAVGAGLVRLATRRRELLWVEAPGADDAV